MLESVLRQDNLSYQTTEQVKNRLVELVRDRDVEPLNKKVLFYKNELAPVVEELIRRNPFPIVEDQVPVVLGVWTPIWSTIPFHDNLPGRVREQSYQIFQNNGYYANIARYAPGQRFSFLNNFSSILAAYDLMVLQRFKVEDNQWRIQNVGIEQAFRKRDIPLNIDDAEAWFATVVASKFNAGSQKAEIPKELKLENLDNNTVKKFEKTYLAAPLFEHLYVDHDLRIVKSQREAKQRPSYTIAVRRR